MHQAQPQRLADIDERKAGHGHADQHGVEHQHAPIAEASHQLDRRAFGGHAGQCYRHHHQPGIHRAHAQAHLQQQRNQERHRAAAHACEQVAQNADAVARYFEQRQGKQRVGGVARMQPVAGQCSQSADGQQHHERMAQAEFRDAIQRQRQGHHAERQHQVADQVEALACIAIVVGHDLQRGNKPEYPDRQVDQEHPVPRGDFDQPAAQGRADQRADQGRNRDEAHRAQEVCARHRLEHRQSPDRQQHRAADALHHACGHQLRQVLRGCAQQRAQSEHDDRGEEGAPGTEAVRDPARGGDEHRHRQRITEDHRLHLQRAFAQAASHRRQRRVDDGRIQHLHEDRQRHQPQQRLDAGVGAQGGDGLRHGGLAGGTLHYRFPAVHGAERCVRRPACVCCRRAL